MEKQKDLFKEVIFSTVYVAAGNQINACLACDLLRHNIGRWEPSCVLSIATMCQDISMTSEELEFLVQKILR